jgi:hypothetical protein
VFYVFIALSFLSPFEMLIAESTVYRYTNQGRSQKKISEGVQVSSFGTAEPGARSAHAHGRRPCWGRVQGGGRPSRNGGPGV